MKIISIAIIALVSITFIIQNSYGQQLRIGIKGGHNLSHFKIESTNYSINHSKVGYHVGIFSNIKLISWFCVQPELLFNKKGHSGEYFDYHLDYIDLPLLLVLNFKSKYNVHFGPYASFLANEGIVSEIPGLGTDLNRNSFKKLDYGFTAGTGFDFKLISLGIRYNWGVVSIINDYRLAGKLYNIGDAKNSLWQIFLAINLVKI
ncbi:MAG: PorT family protein [Bacteroidota bacterium]|nr:PorT family protein [Bacteroidota bacterium]